MTFYIFTNNVCYKVPYDKISKVAKKILFNNNNDYISVLMAAKYLRLCNSPYKQEFTIGINIPVSQIQTIMIHDENMDQADEYVQANFCDKVIDIDCDSAYSHFKINMIECYNLEIF